MHLMRWVFLWAGLTVAALQTGCAGTPASLGITGPGAQVPPDVTPADTPMAPPGLPDPNTGSAPDQRFYHYN